MKKTLAIILAVLMIAVSASGCATGTESEKALKIGNTEYTVADFNALYVMTFSSFYSYYGSTINSKMDLSKPLSEQFVSEDESWEDYFIDYTYMTLKDLTALYELAIAEGIELPEEDRESLDSLAKNLEDDAAAYGTDVQTYIEDMYGKGVTYSNLYKIMEIQSYAIAYSNYYKENKVTVTEDEVWDYYRANSKLYDTADFLYYYVPYTSDISESGYSKKEADAIAEAFRKTGTKEEFVDLAYEYTRDEDAKEQYLTDEDLTYAKDAGYQDIGIEEVADWIFDGSRKEGDVIAYDDTEYSMYIIIMFVKVNSCDYTLKNVRHIVMSPERSEDGTVSDEAWEALKLKAEAVYQEYKDGPMTEDSFAALAVKYTEDAGAENGGLYGDIYRGKTVDDFEEWCFEEGRKPGDTGIIRSSYGYHVMYFVGEGMNYVDYALTNEAASEKYSKWVNSLNDSLEVTEYEGFKKVGNIIDVIYNKAMERAQELVASEEGTETDLDVSVTEGN